MSTTVRIVCEIEMVVDTWNSKDTFETLAQRAVREGRQKLVNLAKGEFELRKVTEVKFVTHSIPWEAKHAD
jgi:hypothetical protein